jgi:hypothetical protein
MKTKPRKIFIRDFDYQLPQEKIALYPLAKRDDSKLLVYRNDSITDDHFYNLPDHLPKECLLVLNDTRVIEARIFFQKPTGGIIEIFCLEPHEQSMEVSLSQTSRVEWQCLIGGASKWKPGQLLEKNIYLQDQNVVLTARYTARQADHFIIEFSWTPGEFAFADILHAMRQARSRFPPISKGKQMKKMRNVTRPYSVNRKVLLLLPLQLFILLKKCSANWKRKRSAGYILHFMLVREPLNR